MVPCPSEQFSFNENGRHERSLQINDHSGDPKQQKNTAFKGKIRQTNTAKIRIFVVFDVFRRFLPIFEVLEAREALQKLPGGGALQFHRI